MSLVINNLTLGYDQIAIVHNVSLTIPEGKITMIIGGNGCGKSTLLHGMSRLLVPMKGDVTLYGKSIHAYKPKELAKKLAILPQGPEATEGMTVRELCEFGRNPYKSLLRTAITDEEDGIINRAIEVTGLSQFANRTLESLSGGQRQRAWIAMTLTQESDIILLDEPTTYLDLAYQIETLNLLKRLNEVSSKTIVIVLHELNQAAKYADYLVCMKQGKIHAEGEVDKVFTAQLIKDVFDLETIIIKNPVCDRPMCIPL